TRGAMIYPIAGGAPKLVAGFDPGEVVVAWGGDSHDLLVFRRNELPAKVYRLNPDTGARRLWREFIPSDPAGVYFITPILTTPDEKSYVYTYRRLLSELYLAA